MVNNDRGQLILVGALLVALVVVSIVVLLNGLQFTEHVGSENSLQEVHDLETTQTEVRHNLRSLFYEVDSEHAGIDTPEPYATERSLTDTVDAYGSTLSSTTVASRGTYTSVSLSPFASRRGVVVYQAGEGDARSANGQSRWDVLRRADAVPVVEVALDGVSGEDFVLQLRQGGDVWRLRVRPGKTVQVRPSAPRAAWTDVCTASDRLSISIEGGHGTVRDGGRVCGGFEMGPELTSSDPVTVRFVGGDAVSGATFVVSGVDPDEVPPAFVNDGRSTSPSAYGDDADEPSPTEEPIVDPKFTLTYRSQHVTYTSTFWLYEEAP
ncbi:MAG: hypothetical protein ABEI96_10805 [Haloarculaceae archaeon]